MSQRSVRIFAAVLLVVVAAAIAAGISYFAQQRQVAELQAQLGEAKQQRDAAQDRLDAAQAANASSTTTQSAESADEAAAQSDEPTRAAKPVTSRQFALVRKATDKNDRMSLVVDFAQFLTGGAAEEAAKEAGDEPPPNDFYIANTNPKLRTFAVDKRAKFRVAWGSPDDTELLSAEEFVRAIDENTDGAADAFYWFTITNGVITAGEQQWTP